MENIIKEFGDTLKSGQFLETLIDTLPGAYYFVKNLQGQFVAANDEFATLMGGESVGAIIGKTDFDLVPDFLAKHFKKGDERVFSSGKPVMNEIELVPTLKGSIDWLCTSKIPLFDKNDQVAGLAGITRLINDRDEMYMNHPEMRIIVSYLRDHYAKKITMATVAKEANISVSKQERLFKKLFGITPLMYLQKVRLNAACALLRNSKRDLATIAVDTGFNDQTNMTRAFRLELNVTPLKYRKNYSLTN